jgi:hypothetical protein
LHHHLSRYSTALLTALILLMAGWADEPLRTWTDASGKFTIQGKFIKLEDGKVTLEKADGTQVTIEESKLKFEDRSEARQANGRVRRSENAKNSAQSPFKEVGKADRHSQASQQMAELRKRLEPARASGVIELKKIDWTSVKNLSVDVTPWKAPPVVATDLALGFIPKPVSIAVREPFERALGLVVHAGTRRAYVITNVQQGRGMSSILHVCDLEKGAVVKTVNIPGDHRPLAISIDGKTLVTREEEFHGHHSILILWQMSDTDVKPLHRIDTARMSNSHKSTVNGAAFVADGSLLTWQVGGMYTWWNPSDATPMKTIQLQGDMTPALSHDGKRLAAKRDRDLVLLDAVTGETIGCNQDMLGHVKTLAFSPDGKHLAVFNSTKVEVLSLATAKVIKSITHSNQRDLAPLYWSSPTALLAGLQLSYLSTELNVSMWKYHGCEMYTFAGDTTFCLAEYKGFTLVPLKLPHDVPTRIVEKAVRDPQSFILKPGTTVSIDVTGIEDLKLRKEVTKVLERHIEHGGFKLGLGGSKPPEDAKPAPVGKKQAPAGKKTAPSKNKPTAEALTLVASVTRGKDHEVSYTVEGPAFGNREKTHTIPGWVYELKLVANGITHWAATAGNHPPAIIRLQQGESVETHLKQYIGTNHLYFLNMELPPYVAKVTVDQTTSTPHRSQITINGLR